MKKQSNLINFLKLFSGRVLLTIICGTVFIMLAHTVCGILATKAAEITFESLSGTINMLLLIVSNVITFYFSKDKSEDKNEKSKRSQEDEWQVSIKKTK